MRRECPAGTVSGEGDACVCQKGSHQVGDLVSFFPLDRTLVDDLSSATMASSSTAYHTDAAHGPVLNANGNVYTITSQALATVLDASAFTVSFWIYFVSLPSNDHSNILTRWDNYDAPYSATGGFLIMTSTNQKLQFAASSQSYYSATTLQVSRWYHVSVVKTSSSSIDLYLDGVLDVRWTAATRAMLNPIKDIGIGSYCYSSSSSSTAATCTTMTNNAMFYLMDLRFYSRGLSAAEAATLATRTDHKAETCINCGAGLTTLTPGASSNGECVCMTASYENHPNLQVHYKFDDIAANQNKVLNSGKLAAGGDGVYTMSEPENVVVESGEIFDTRVRWTTTTAENFLSLSDQFLDQLESAFTISTWLKTTSSSSDNDFLVLAYRTGTTNDAANKYIRIQPHSNGNLYFDIGDGGDSSNQRTYTTFPTNQMTHWAFTMERSGTTQTTAIFKNGESVATLTQNWELDFDHGSTTRKFKVGSNIGQASLEDFRIYDVALEAEDILKLYNDKNADSGVCQECPSGTTSPVGSTSSDACSCPTGTFGSTGAVLAFNPSAGAETFDRSIPTEVDLGPVQWNVLNNGGVTLVAKIKFSSSPTRYERVFAATDSATAGNALFQIMRRDQEEKMFFIFNDGDTNCVSPDIAITNEQWISMKFWFNSATNNMEVQLNDGDIYFTDCSSVSGFFAQDRLQNVNIFGRHGGSSPHFHGAIAGFYGWNSYLLAEAVDSVLNSIVVGGPDTLPTLQCTSCPTDGTYLPECGCPDSHYVAGTTTSSHFNVASDFF